MIGDEFPGPFAICGDPGLEWTGPDGDLWPRRETDDPHFTRHRQPVIAPFKETGRSDTLIGPPPGFAAGFLRTLIGTSGAMVRNTQRAGRPRTGHMRRR